MTQRFASFARLSARIVPARLPASLAAFSFVLGATAACVNPTNPYDIDAPEELQARATIRGDVRANVATDGERPAIEGASVVITLSDGSDVDDVTDADGVFVLADLPPGFARIVVTHPDFQAYSADLTPFAPGEERNEVNLFLSPFSAEGDGLAVVTGTVLKEGETLDHSGIVVRDVNDSTFFGVTRQDGSVELRVAPGARELIVDEFGFEQATIEVDASTNAATSFGSVTIPFVPGEVFGQIAVENPAVAQSISISLDAGGTDQVVADGDGNYRLPVVPAGVFRLTAFADGHDSLEVGGVTVVPGEETEVQALFLRRSRGAISGIARYAPGFDADNSGIVVSVAGTSAIGTTDVDGAFVIENVPTNVDGGYTLSFRADDFLTQSVDGVEVNKNATTTLATPVVLAKQIGDFEIIPAPYTATADVTLRLAPIPQGAVQLRIAEDSAFTGVDYAAFPTDGDGSIETDVPYTMSADDGQVTLYVQYLLSDDSEAGPFSSSVVLDRLAPVVEAVVLDTGSGVTNAANVLVSVEATDANVPTRYEVSEEEAFDNPAAITSNAYGVPTRITFADSVSDGPRTIFVRVFDAAGNVSDTATATIVRDTTPPALAAFSLDCQGVIDAAICGDTSVGLTIDAPEANAWFVSLAPGAQPQETDWNSFQDALVFGGLGLAQGERTLYLLLRDAAGNVSDVFSDSITIDTAAPSAASVLIDNGAAFIEAGRTTAQLTLFALGADQMRISADADTTDDQAVAYAPTVDVTLPTPLVDGPLTYYVTFVDEAGNEVTVSDSIVIDTFAPTPGPLPITIDGQAGFTASLSVTLSLDAVDAAEMQLTIDDTATVSPPTVTDWIPFAATSLALLPAGDCDAGAGACKQVCARFRDEAGNETATNACATIALDATPPAPAIISAAPDVTDERTATVVLAEEPVDVNFSAYEILVTPGGAGFVEVDASPTSPPTFTISLPDPGGEVTPAYENKTEYLVRIRAVDAGGNLGPEATQRIIYDEWAPAAPTIGSASTTVNADTFSVLLDAASNTAADDATFANYEVAQISCPGFQRATCEAAAEPATFTPTAQTDGILFTLNQGLAAGCLAPCANRLFIRAVDEAGNIGPAASIIIDEDSQSPSKPKMLPKTATTYGDQAVMRIESEASDDTEVTYEVRGGALNSFTTYSVEEGGIVAVPLVRNEVNEVCIRAKDAAGNVSVEECSVVTQEEQVIVATEDDIDSLHLEDDYVSIVFDRDTMKVRDLRTDVVFNVGGPGSHDTSGFVGVVPPLEVTQGAIAVTDGALEIAYIALGRAPNDNFYRWIGYRNIPVTEPSLFPAAGQECNFPEEFETRCQTGRYQELGSIPLMYDLDEFAQVFLGAGYLLMRRKQLENPGLGTPERTSLDAMILASNAPVGTSDVALRGMNPGFDLCPATTVEIERLSETETLFVWCESDGGDTGMVYRRTVTAVDSGGGFFTTSVGALEELGTTTIEKEDLFDGAERFNQPAVTTTTTYWVQDGELRSLPHDSAVGADTNVDPTLDGSIKRLTKTVGGDRLSMVRFSGTPGASPAYVYTYDLDPTVPTPLKQITNGLVTPYEAVVDGPRIMWLDRATLRSAVSYQSLGELEWLAHGPQITAFPSTDGVFTSFIDGRDGNVSLYVAHGVEGLEYQVTDEIALEGVNEGGRTVAAGTALWSRRVGTPPRYQLMTSNLAEVEPSGFPQSCPVPIVAGVNAASPPDAMSLDHTANIIAFAQGTQIYVSRRLGACEWDPPSVIDDINGDEAEDIDVIDMGDPLVVWSVGFEVERDRLYYRHGNRSGDIADNRDEGFEAFVPLSAELARDGENRVVFAGRFFSENADIPPGNPVPAAGEGMLYCTVAESGPTLCEDAKKTFVSANVFGGELRRATLTENGLLITTETGTGFAGTSHLLVIDTRTGRQRTLLPAFLGDFAATDANAGYTSTQVDGSQRVTFSSTMLGAVDVWTAEALR